MYKIIIVLLTLNIANHAYSQQSSPRPKPANDVYNEESEDRFLEIIRQRFEKDVGDLEKLMEKNGNVDQFFQQRLKQLMIDAGEGIDQGNTEEMYVIEELKDRYIVKPRGAIDSKIPCKIDVNEKEIHFKASMLAPYHRTVDFKVAIPQDAKGSAAKVEIDPAGMVLIVIPKR
jgi:hypothetical protein